MVNNLLIINWLAYRKTIFIIFKKRKKLIKEPSPQAGNLKYSNHFFTNSIPRILIRIYALIIYKFILKWSM